MLPAGGSRPASDSTSRLPDPAEGGVAMEEAQRQATLAVRRVLDGTTLPVALAAMVSPGDPMAGADPGRRRALVQELAYGTLRYWGTLAALTGKLAAKPFS